MQQRISRMVFQEIRICSIQHLKDTIMRQKEEQYNERNAGGGGGAVDPAVKEAKSNTWIVIAVSLIVIAAAVAVAVLTF